MKNIILLVITLSFSSKVFSAGGSQYLTFEPIVGYERVQKLSPTVHTKARLIYGVRANFGPPLISIEGQVTQGNDTEVFPLLDLTIKEEVINAMLGLRSQIGFGPLGFYIRAGGHARKSKITTTKAGASTVKEPAIYASPYAGTGISLKLASMLRVNAGITVIFSGRPKGSDQEYQTTLGFALKF